MSKAIPIDAPRITIEVVTPQDAARMLGTMKGNRHLRQKVVQRYAREMIAGKWLLNGEAIKVARDGRLIDGQHRLNAVVLAKLPVQMCVVRGVDAAAMITLDTGVGRTFYDYGTIDGRSFAQAVGPIIRWWFKYQTSTPGGKPVPTMQEMQQILDDHPVINDSAGFIAKLKTVRQKCLPSVMGFVHAYASEKYDRDMADLFMVDLNEGANLDKTSPVYSLRKRLVDSDAKTRFDPVHVLAWSIKAWNAWVKGEKLQLIKWVPISDKGGEDFPRFDVDVAPDRRQRHHAKLRAVRASKHVPEEQRVATSQ